MNRCNFIPKDDASEDIAEIILPEGDSSPLYQKMIEVYESHKLAYAHYLEVLDDYDIRTPFDEPDIADIDTDKYGKTNKATVVRNLETQIMGLSKDSDGYKYLGEVVSRVTNIVQEKVYEPIYGKKENDTEFKQDSVLARTKGTVFHAYAEIVLKELERGRTYDEILNDEKGIMGQVKAMTEADVIKEWEAYEDYHSKQGNPVISPDITDDFFIMDNRQANNAYRKSFFADLVKHQQLLRDEIYKPAYVAKRGQPTIFFEQQVYDSKRKVAGTIDVLVVYDDGTISIYDYKFKNMDFYYSKDQNKMVAGKQEINDTAIKAYNMQLGEYKRILTKQYGAKNHGEFRIVPVAVAYNKPYKNKAGQLQTNRPLQGVSHMEFRNLEEDLAEKEYLRQVVFNDEITGNEKLDRFLIKLRGVQKRMDTKLSKEFNNEALKDERNKLRTSINEILINQSLDNVTDTIKAYLSYAQSVVDNYEMEKKKTEDNKALNGLSMNVINNLREVKELLEIFDLMRTFSIDLLNESNKTDAEKASYKAYMATFQDRIYKTRDGVNIALIDALQQVTSVDLAEEYKELSLSDYTRTFSQIDNPYIQALKTLTFNALEKKNVRVEELKEEIIQMREGLLAWTKTKGISEKQAYDKITDKSKGTLINRYRQDYYDARTEAFFNNDIEWLKENHEMSSTWEKQYHSLREKRLETVTNGYKGDPEKKQQRTDYLMELFDSKYDLNRESAWRNKSNYDYYALVIKDEAKWQTESFKEISMDGNEPLLKLYDYLRKKNYEFKGLLQTDIKGNFIPSIRKNTLERLMSDMGMKDIIVKESEQFLESIKAQEVYQDEVSATDPNKLRSVPIFYTSKIDPQDKSYDLLSSLLIFGDMAYNVDNMRQIENASLTLRDLLADAEAQGKALITDNRGNVVIDQITGMFKKKAGIDNISLDLYERFMNYYVYGESLQNKDIEIGGMSANRMLSKLMSYMSVNALAVNIKSALPAFLGASANTYMNGVKGQFYNREQMNRAHNMFATAEDKHKFRILADFFKPEKQNWVKRDADSLRPSAVRRNVTYDKLYFMQQQSEEFISRTILIAMMQNFGLTEDGRVMKMSILPEGSKSLLDLSVVDDATDKVSITGLTEESFNVFKRKVQNVVQKTKGSNLEEDISAIQTHIGGRAIMHFRNWIAPMMEERFRGMRYNKEVDDFEVGRYRVMMGEMYDKSIKQKALQIGTTILDLGLGAVSNKFRIKTTRTEYHFNKYLEDNPESKLAKQIDNGEVTQDEAIKMYDELRMMQLRAMIVELRMALLTFSAIMAMGTDWDDDGEKMYQEFAGGKHLYDMLKRTHNELTFFYAPQSVQDILKAPIPIMGIMNTIISIPVNGVDEVLDYMFGEEIQSGKNKGERERQKGDNTDMGHYSLRALPTVRPIADIMSFLAELTDEEKK